MKVSQVILLLLLGSTVNAVKTGRHSKQHKFNNQLVNLDVKQE